MVGRLGQELRRRVGAVPNVASRRTLNVSPRFAEATTCVSVCPYCAVGCSQLVHTIGGQIVNIEGNPASPINGGTLCPKGSATFGLVTSPLRILKVRYRAPHATDWEDRSLDWAMDRIARLVKTTRDGAFEVSDASGQRVNRTLGIAHLGGATLDNEENYLIKKLFTAGLGIVAVENQARI